MVRARRPSSCFVAVRMSCAQSELFIHQPSFLAPDENAELFFRLSSELPWQSEFIAFGRRVCLPRHQVWYAEAHVDSRYSANNLLPRQNFTPVLRVLKRRIEARCGRTFNSLLATLYRDGNDHVGYHADDDEELGPQPLIASLSLGGTRRFWLRPKLPTPAQSAHPIALMGGDLLLMLPGLQREWEHAVLVEPECREPRINLTFRRVN
jgi:alkylated DNA repair dioxygenase AlkB